MSEDTLNSVSNPVVVTSLGVAVTRREDGTVAGWRAVDSATDLLPSETYEIGSPPTPEPSHEENVATAAQTINMLYEQATRIINPLQDAVDVGDATEEEVSKLAVWKAYRAKLGRVDTNLAPDIALPGRPS